MGITFFLLALYNVQEHEESQHTKAPRNEMIMQSNYIFYTDGDMKITVSLTRTQLRTK
jgi:hypothetical protein